MYYKSVNRGLSVTRAGIYSIAFVLGIGLIAIISGANGLYLFLSLALSILIVSGLLSESTIKSTKITCVERVTVSAGESFGLSFQLTNLSKHFIVYGINIYFFVRKPRISLFGGVKNQSMFAQARLLIPDASINCTASCAGLPRGKYNNLFVSQNTNYPFGILEKYKYTSLDFEVTVLPPVDLVFSKELSADFKSRMSILGTDRDFYCHRPYLSRDSVRAIDWKKSANKLPTQWVTKEYHSHANVTRILVLLDWDLARSTTDDTGYERYLSRIRTAVDIVRTWNLPVGLSLSDFAFTWKYERICSILADLPKFSGRLQPLNVVSDAEELGKEHWVLTIGLDYFRMSSPILKKMKGGG